MCRGKVSRRRFRVLGRCVATWRAFSRFVVCELFRSILHLSIHAFQEKESGAIGRGREV